jgi:putative Mn2+ efflux pump MntP
MDEVLGTAVRRISVSIIVSFIARVLGTTSGNLFCYSAIASGGVVLILPGFTIRESRFLAADVLIDCPRQWSVLWS